VSASNALTCPDDIFGKRRVHVPVVGWSVVLAARNIRARRSTFFLSSCSDSKTTVIGALVPALNLALYHVMTHHTCLAQTTFPQDVSDGYQDHSLDNAATSCNHGPSRPRSRVP
jgi:hypothetical protein